MITAAAFGPGVTPRPRGWRGPPGPDDPGGG
jgi:hypothetical protein